MLLASFLSSPTSLPFMGMIFFSLTSYFYTMPKLKAHFFFLHPSRQLLGISPKLLCFSPKLQWKCSWASFRVHFQVPLLIPQGGVPPAVLPLCLDLYLQQSGSSLPHPTLWRSSGGPREVTCFPAAFSTMTDLVISSFMQVVPSHRVNK